MSWEKILKRDMPMITTEQLVELLNKLGVEFLNKAFLHKYQDYSGKRQTIKKPFKTAKWFTLSSSLKANYNIKLETNLKNKGSVIFMINYNPTKHTKNVKVTTDIEYKHRDSYGMLDAIKRAIAHNVRSAQQDLAGFGLRTDGHFFDTKDIYQTGWEGKN
tara:strand:+ start:54 stop:533 length:480 start_codon:yes stop_codon:yes gene_type:complete